MFSGGIEGDQWHESIYFNGKKIIPKQYKRKINNSNDKKMPKESRSGFDYFWRDDEIQFLLSSAL